MASLIFDREQDEDQLLTQALYIDDNEIDDIEGSDKPPATGEEYLRKVVKERRKCDDTSTGIKYKVWGLCMYRADMYSCLLN